MSSLQIRKVINEEGRRRKKQRDKEREALHGDEGFF